MINFWLTLSLKRAAKLKEVPGVSPGEEMYLLPARPGAALRADPAPLDVIINHRVQLRLGEVPHLHRDEGVERPPALLPQ